MYTYIPSSLDFLPIQVITEHWGEFPKLDSRLSSVIYFPDAGKHWGQEEKGMIEDELVGWHYWLNGHEFEQTPGDSEGQGSLECYSPWGRKELDTT